MDKTGGKLARTAPIVLTAVGNWEDLQMKWPDSPTRRWRKLEGPRMDMGKCPFQHSQLFFFFFLLVAAQPWSLPMLSKLLVYPPVLGFLDL